MQFTLKILESNQPVQTIVLDGDALRIDCRTVTVGAELITALEILKEGFGFDHDRRPTHRLSYQLNGEERFINIGARSDAALVQLVQLAQTPPQNFARERQATPPVLPIPAYVAAILESQRYGHRQFAY